ncbi:MAG: hypothetical protein EOM54_10960 [Clostridia bacterium]|nr:hypothetical protein [Clostridia bacterium]
MLIGERYRDKLNAPLKTRGIEAIWLPENKNVDPRLSGHADLSVIHLGGDKLVAQGDECVNILTNRGFDVIPSTSPQRAEYPADAGLCGCILGEFFIHNPQLSDKAVLKNLGSRKIISVNQGYAKCAVCVVAEKTIITSDAGIAGSAESNGIEVLKIRPGHIGLEGFGYGFIGGSTFKLSEHEMAFTGTLSDHPDSIAIIDFLGLKGITPVFLTDSPIFDIGSAVTISEL